MITGDHMNIAKELSRQIGLGHNILNKDSLKKDDESVADLILKADGFAEVLPLDKLRIVETLQDMDMIVGMTGDGVNDAPALARADIGIAVEGATDAAQAAADIVLTRPGLSPICTAVLISRRIFKRLKSYIVYRICITVQAVFFLASIAFLFKARFQSLYVILLALLHDFQIVTIAYDHQVAGAAPETPRVNSLLIASYALGIFMAAQSTLMYGFGDIFMDADFKCMPNSDNACNYKDSAMFLQISNSSAILILSARTVGWFWSTYPAKEVFLSAAVGQVVVTGIMLLPKGNPLENFIWPIRGKDVLRIWIYDFVCLLVLDAMKQFIGKKLAGYEEKKDMQERRLPLQERRLMAERRLSGERRFSLPPSFIRGSSVELTTMSRQLAGSPCRGKVLIT
jgi:H+-transporting ATPase